MATTNNTSVTYTKSEIFSLMNRLKKQHNLSQKEAYAMAKAELEGKSEATLADELIRKMQNGNVKFRFENRGKSIVTTGTLMLTKAPTNKRKVEGSQKTKNDNMVIFYDIRHGVYRQFDRNKVQEILSK